MQETIRRVLTFCFMDSSETFSTLDIVRALDNVHTQRLRGWIDAGFIVPSIQRASGYGTKNLFSRRDVYGIALFRTLVTDLKISRDLAAEYVKEFVDNKNPEPGDHILLRVNDGKVVAWTLPPNDWKLDIETAAVWVRGHVLPEPGGGKPPIMPDKNWDYALLINFKKIRDEVDASL